MRLNKNVFLIAGFGLTALVGCGEEAEITSYTTDKPGHVDPQVRDQMGMPMNHPSVMPGTQPSGNGEDLVAPTQLDGIAFEVPEAWRYTGVGQFLLASFQITPATKMTISQAGGALTAQVNRWRGQLGLGSVEGEVDPASLEHIETAVGEMLIVDLASEDGTRRMRIGMMPHMSDGQPTGQTWFFKLDGDGSDVEENVAAFDSMLAGLSPAQ